MCAFFDPRLTRAEYNKSTRFNRRSHKSNSRHQWFSGRNGLHSSVSLGPHRGTKHTADIFQAIEYTVFLNKEGKRYVAEDARRDVIRDATLAQTDQTVFPVCDADGFDKNNEYYNEMNHRALENGTLFKADTIEELAKLINFASEGNGSDH